GGEVADPVADREALPGRSGGHGQGGEPEREADEAEPLRQVEQQRPAEDQEADGVDRAGGVGWHGLGLLFRASVAVRRTRVKADLHAAGAEVATGARVGAGGPGG